MLSHLCRLAEASHYAKSQTIMSNEFHSDEHTEVPQRGPREAGPPFDDEDADLILRSSDGVDFRVHKLFLIKAFHTFDDMLVCGSLILLVNATHTFSSGVPMKHTALKRKTRSSRMA